MRDGYSSSSVNDSSGKTPGSGGSALGQVRRPVRCWSTGCALKAQTCGVHRLADHVRQFRWCGQRQYRGGPWPWASAIRSGMSAATGARNRPARSPPPRRPLSVPTRRAGGSARGPILRADAREGEQFLELIDDQDQLGAFMRQDALALARALSVTRPSAVLKHDRPERRLLARR